MKPATQDVEFIEWNLGGGKSSRFLQKNLTISAREVLPEQWRIDLDETYLEMDILIVFDPTTNTVVKWIK